MSVLGVRIQIPAEAVVPLLIGVGVLLVLLFAGAALKDWKDKHPGAARIAGSVLAVGFTGGAGYLLAQVLTQTEERHAVHTGIQLVGLFDGPIIGFCGALAVMLWKFAGQRAVAIAIGGLVGAALVIKPFVWGLGHTYDGRRYTRDWLDLEHIGFYGPGIVVLVMMLVVAFSPTPIPPRR